jgi:hypothetical protein
VLYQLSYDPNQSDINLPTPTPPSQNHFPPFLPLQVRRIEFSR